MKESEALKVVNDLSHDALSFQCKNCDFSSKTRKKLKEHISQKHSTQIRCSLCENIFEKNSELDMHIKTFHNMNGEFKCEKCDKKFFLDWRLKKHLQIHFGGSDKKCYYFNNNKVCPLEEIGC